MSDPMLYSTIEALAKRVSQLEADRCTCPKCLQRDRERERVAAVTRYLAIASMADATARNAAIAALEGAAVTIFSQQYMTAPMLLAMPEDMRRTYLDRVPPQVRDLVMVEAVEVPRTCVLAMSAPTRAWYRDARITIEADAARQLRALGLGDHVVAGGGTENRDAYRTLAFATGDQRRVRREAVALLRKVDPALDEAITSGLVVVTECTESQDREALLAEWSRKPVYERDPLPRRVRERHESATAG